tara:strand:+ start:2551 stop:5403 length:2853 start_codon:yes stop_codon:yes gene_type:complete
MNEEYKRLLEQLQRLKKEYQSLFRGQKPMFEQDGKNAEQVKFQIKQIETVIRSSKREAAGLADVFTDIGEQLKANLSEIDKANTSLGRGKRAYRDIVGTVRQLADEEAGIDRLSFAQLKKLKSRNASALKETIEAGRRLNIERSITSEADIRRAGLSESEAALSRAALSGFENEKRAGRFVEARLRLERKVLDTTKLTGGALQGIGNLAASLGLQGFAESLEEIKGGLDDELRSKIRETAIDQFDAGLKEGDKYRNKIQEISDITRRINSVQKRIAANGGVATKVQQDFLDKQNKKLENAEEFVENSEEAIQNLYEQSAATATLGSKFKALIKAGKEFSKQLSDPLVLIGAMAKGFTALDQKSVEFQRLTGQNAKALASMNTQMVLGTEVLEMMTNFSKDFSVNMSSIFTPETLGELGETTKLLGLSSEQSNRLASNIALSGMSVNAFEESAFEAAKAVGQSAEGGVNLGQALSDINSTSAAVALSLGNNPVSLARATAEAQRLGMSLDRMDDIAGSLLDFESSIQAELEAQLLTGKNINLAKAREFALNNDLENLSKEILNNNALSSDFGRANRVTQEAMAKAMGMSREELAKMIVIEKLRSKISMEEVARQQGLSLEQVKQISTQEKFNTTIGKLQQSLAPVLDAFIPVIDAIAAAIGPISKGIAKITQLGTNIRNLFERDVKGSIEDSMGSIGHAMDKSGIGQFLKMITGGAITIGFTAGLGALVANYLTRGTVVNPTITKDVSKGGGMFDAFFGPGSKGKKGKAKRMKLAGRAGRIGGLGALLFAGADMASNLMEAAKDEDGLTAKDTGNSLLKTLNQNKFTAIGGLVGGIAGSVIPGAGTVAGAGLGASIGGFLDSMFPPEEELAKGGIVTKPIKALVGEAGPEAVVPLSKLPQMTGGGLSLEGLNVKFDEMISKLDELTNIKGDVYIDGNKTGQAIFSAATNLS